ncbi:MAG: hypothetical protein J6X18_12745 [Bacteroidales bacterium]|nr:hypothetical protein [Bacteroidales bacterium]
MKTNIIAIRKTNSDQANQAFSELMGKTEKILNQKSIQSPNLYKKISSSDLEKESVDIIKQACSGTLFQPEEVKLISGQKFPDITVEKYYGVEVKSTDKNHWVSTGSSIVESTRVAFVENIYMLFGKLGGNPPEFRCRPYQDVLYDIAVTHSPRYLINMELKQGQSIFAKMNTSYDKLRTSPDCIDQVRKYYREKAKQEKKEEMPWWLSNKTIDNAMSFNIRLWDSLSIEEKRDLLANCLILFPETMSPKSLNNKYNQASLWLCSYCQVVNPHIRDTFSAGGTIKYVNEVALKTPVAKIFKTIVDCSDRIKQLLSNPSADMLKLMEEFNPSLLKNRQYYTNWQCQCEQIGEENNVPIREWIEKSVQMK